jgi:hypothetical protein
LALAPPQPASAAAMLIPAKKAMNLGIIGVCLIVIVGHLTRQLRPVRCSRTSGERAADARRINISASLAVRHVGVYERRAD